MNARNLRTALAGAILACGSLAAQAGGEVLVINETDQGMAPYFRYNCFGFTPVAGPGGWVFFGGIGAHQRFGWDFNDPFLTRADCKKPHLQFTFTAVGAPPPDAEPEVVGNIKFDPNTNFHLQAGGKLRATNLLDDE